METTSEVVGERIRQRLGRRPQAELARVIGVAPATLSRWLSGHTPIRLNSLRRIARYFGCEVADLTEPGPDPGESPTVRSFDPDQVEPPDELLQAVIALNAEAYTVSLGEVLSLAETYLGGETGGAHGGAGNWTVEEWVQVIKEERLRKRGRR